MKKEPYSIDKLLKYLDEYGKKPTFTRALITMYKINHMESGRKLDLEDRKKKQVNELEVGIHRYPFGTWIDGVPAFCAFVLGPNNEDYEHGGDGLPDEEYLVCARSRSRFITPEDDTQGFAKWVWANADALVDLLGESLHSGEREWWEVVFGNLVEWQQFFTTIKEIS